MNLSLWWTSLSVAWLVLEVFIAVGVRTRRGKGKVQDRGTQLILWIVIALSLTASGWLRGLLPADSLTRIAWLRPLSLMLLAGGLGVRLAAILTLGRSFSANVATHAAQTLQRSGLYRIVRHPSYLGMEIIFLAVGLHARHWICLAVDLLPPTLAVLYRIHVEEQALLGAFGEEYVQYSRTTKRLLPGVY